MPAPCTPIRRPRLSVTLIAALLSSWALGAASGGAVCGHGGLLVWWWQALSGQWPGQLHSSGRTRFGRPTKASPLAGITTQPSPVLTGPGPLTRAAMTAKLGFDAMREYRQVKRVRANLDANMAPWYSR